MKRPFTWDKKYLHWGVTAFLVIISSIVFFLLLSRLSLMWAVVRQIFDALSPIIYGLVLAYLLNKMMSFFEDRLLSGLGRRLFPAKPETGRRFSRASGITLTLLLTVVIIGGVLALVIPQIIVSVKHLIDSLDDYYRSVEALAVRFLAANPDLETYVVQFFGSATDSLAKWLKTTLLEQTQQIIVNVTSGVLNVVKAIVSMIIGFVVSVYILHNKERFSAQCKRLVYGFFKPQRANSIIKNTRFLDQTVGGFILGKIIESLIVGIISYIFLLVFGMPYAVLIAVLLALTNLVPFFGSFIGAVPSALMILLEDPLKCLIFVVFIIVLHLFANNILSPRVQGETIGLDGFWVLFAILLFGGLFGFWGLFLGVPIFAVIYAAVRKFNSTQLTEKNYPVLTKDYERLYLIDPDTGKPVYEPAETTNANTHERKPSGRHGKKHKNRHNKNH